jgi:hypothetical protein
MEWMKVIYNNKNMMNKEFQHCVESKLIEVMMMKMQMIQFVSIVNLIQMKLMKVIHNMKNIPNKEFQHCVESQSIEVTNMKMFAIQFVSIVNLIQIKSSEDSERDQKASVSSLKLISESKPEQLQQVHQSKTVTTQQYN